MKTHDPGQIISNKNWEFLEPRSFANFKSFLSRDIAFQRSYFFTKFLVFWTREFFCLFSSGAEGPPWGAEGPTPQEKFESKMFFLLNI